MKHHNLRKLQQVKLGNDLIKVKHDEYDNTFILEHRIKNPVTTNAKYIRKKVTSKDLDLIKWDKYAVSTFYK